MLNHVFMGSTSYIVLCISIATGKMPLKEICRACKSSTCPVGVRIYVCVYICLLKSTICQQLLADGL